MKRHSWIGIMGLLAIVAALLFWPAQAQTQHGVMLTWTAGTPGAGQVAATGYLVERSTVTGGPYTQIASVTVTSYLDTSGTAGSKYFYVVVGTAPGAINSANSTEVSATFLAQTAGPVGLQAVAQ
jgi:hypothetical protein